MALQLDESGEIVRLTQEEYNTKVKELQEETAKLQRVQIEEPRPQRPRDAKGRLLPGGTSTSSVDRSILESQLQGIQDDLKRLLMKPDYQTNQEVVLKDIQEKVAYLYSTVYQPPEPPKRKRFLGLF